MEKIVQQGILYDFYGELLTDHQKKVYESVVYENLSLGEVADEFGISRQAVHDIVKRCDRMLEGYESKLGLIRRFEEVRSRIGSMEEVLNAPFEDSDRDKLLKLIGEIRELI